MRKRWSMFFLLGGVAVIAMHLTLDKQHLGIAPTVRPIALAPPPTVPAKTPASAIASTALLAQATAVTPMKTRQSKIKAYATARDLSAYLDALQTDGSSEDEILTAKARAMEECLIFTIRPNYAAEAIESHARTTQENSVQYRQYIETLSQRCSTLSRSGQVSGENMRAAYAQAANEGNAEAMAYQLSREIALVGVTSSDATPSPAELRQKMLDILNSGDPAALFSASGLFNENSIFSCKATGSPVAEGAWQLAACDLGMDCSENGMLLRGYCINGGFCGPSDLRWNIREVEFSPVAYQKVVALESEIYAAIRSGNAASLF